MPPAAVSNQMKQVIVELIKGPEEDAGVTRCPPMRILPDLRTPVSARSTFATHIVYVDSRRMSPENLPGGREGRTVWPSMPSSIDRFNFPRDARGVKVKILVDRGSQVETSQVTST